MKYISNIMLKASLRNIDMQTREAIAMNDNQKLEKLRQWRSEINSTLQKMKVKGEK